MAETEIDVADGKQKERAAAPDEAELEARALTWARAFLMGKAKFVVTPIPDNDLPNAGLAGGFAVGLGPIEE